MSDVRDTKIRCKAARPVCVGCDSLALAPDLALAGYDVCPGGQLAAVHLCCA